MRARPLFLYVASALGLGWAFASCSLATDLDGLTSPGGAQASGSAGAGAGVGGRGGGAGAASGAAGATGSQAGAAGAAGGQAGATGGAAGGDAAGGGAAGGGAAGGGAAGGVAGGGAAGGGAAGGAAGGGAGGVGGAGGLAGAGGAGGSLCGNGKRDEGEACDSGPQGDETCTGDCAIRCEAASGEGLVDPVTRHCYLLFRTLVSWEGARMRCGALPGGARLVSFDDEHEFEFLAQELVATFNLDQRIWTGGNDLETEGTYVWEGGGSLASQGFPWNESAGEPNNFNGNQDCAAADDASGFLMYDRGCDDTYAYLCERPGPPLAPGRAARGPDRRPRSTLPPRSRSSNLDASS